MRAMILTCNTGQGHNSCAKAIQEVYDAEGVECRIVDALSFVSKGFSKLTAWGHVAIYRHIPGLFCWGYDFTARHPRIFLKNSPFYMLLASGAERLRCALVDGQYDTVICVHVFSGLMVKAMLEKHPMPLKTCFVDTDYTSSPGAQQNGLAHYFLADEALKPECQALGVDMARVICSGIPIRQAFYARQDQSEAKEAMGIPPGHLHLLMMCGSMGCGPMEKLLALVSRGMDENWVVTVVCGTNIRLRRRLERRYAQNPAIRICGYEECMAQLMYSADLYLTKPGGISVSEAAAVGLPMVYINAVAGCEAHNCRFFTQLGGGATEPDVPGLARLCLALMEDESRRDRMRQALQARPRINSARMIYRMMAETPVSAG
ncbi:MAG: polysaccharide biosynthesis protein [Firmicutes bacterium]|nr:polysaccharide biosynthesis protein [Bacillota bacterium]